VTDIVDRKTRSRVMASVRSSGNRSTEKRLRAALMRSKIRGWRVQARDLPGIPDFVFEKKQLAVFVDGCFWHGCPRCYRRPHSSRKYWDEKVNLNKIRDGRISAKLRRNGWSVLRIWEHTLSDTKKVVARIKVKLNVSTKK
jgi:DNA mismatch endonuclease (patch repair protein)